MGRLLGIDTPLMRAWTAAADVVLVNLLTLAACLPVLTAGASLTACARVMGEMARDEDSYVLRSWVRSFRTNLRQSLTWWPPCLLLPAAAAWLNLHASSEAGPATSGTLAGLLLAALAVQAGVLVWLAPLSAFFDNTVPRHLSNAARLAVGHLGTTAVALALQAAPLALWSLLPASRTAVTWFMGLIGVAFLMYLTALLQRRTIDALRGRPDPAPDPWEAQEPPQAPRTPGA